MFLILGKIFNVVKVSNTFENEPEKDLPMAYDGLENLAGYICHRLKNKVSDLETNETNESSWVHHLDEGGLSKPSDTVMAQLLSLENVFNAVNGEGQGIYICAKYIKHMIDISNKSNINCDEKIKKKLFFRSRMYFRIRKLNREIIENKNSRKRKYKKIIN